MVQGQDSRLDAHGALAFAGAEAPCGFHRSDLSSTKGLLECLAWCGLRRRRGGREGETYQQLRTRPLGNLQDHSLANAPPKTVRKAAHANGKLETARSILSCPSDALTMHTLSHPSLKESDSLIFKNSFVSPALYPPTGTCCSSTIPPPPADAFLTARPAPLPLLPLSWPPPPPHAFPEYAAIDCPLPPPSCLCVFGVFVPEERSPREGGCECCCRADWDWGVEPPRRQLSLGISHAIVRGRGEERGKVTGCRLWCWTLCVEGYWNVGGV